jgi:nitroreductase
VVVYRKEDNIKQIETAMFTDLIKKRRSVRSYSDKPIAKDTLQAIIDAVFHAPTASNLNDVELFIVEGKEMLEELSTFRKNYAGHIAKGQAAIVVLSDTEVAPKTNRQDACIAATYILLQAADLGLGACWTNVNSAFDENDRPATIKLHKILGVPEKYNIETVISLGYPLHEPQPKVPRDMEGKVHWGKME